MPSNQRVVQSVRSSVAVHSSLAKYSFTLDDCGIGRESQMMDDSCFDFQKSAEQTDAIRFGRPVRVGEFPWFVSLHSIDTNLTNATGQIMYGDSECSAAIVNQNWIITAAHCLLTYQQFKTNPMPTVSIAPNYIHDKLSLYVGISDENHRRPQEEGVSYDEMYAIAFCYIHPGYELTKQIKFDLTVCRVKRPINMSVVTSDGFKDITGICFPPKWAFNNEYEHALMVGAGYIGSTPVPNITATGRPPIYWTGWTRIYPIGRGGIYSRDDFGEVVRARQLVKEGGSAICPGDSGSPLVQYINGRAVIIGVTFGKVQDSAESKADLGCSTDKYENLFARVSYFIDFISESIALGDKRANDQTNKL